jgi:hypothetical protein
MQGTTHTNTLWYVRTRSSDVQDPRGATLVHLDVATPQVGAGLRVWHTRGSTVARTSLKSASSSVRARLSRMLSRLLIITLFQRTRARTRVRT